MRLLTWPFFGVLAIFQEIVREAEAALYDEERLHAELKALYEAFEGGSISEEEFERREAELAERLEAAEEFHRSRASIS